MSKRNKRNEQTQTERQADSAPVAPSPACACGSPSLNTLGTNTKMLDGQRINWTRRRCPKCGKATTERSCLMI